MKYSLKIKISLSLIIFLGVFVFIDKSFAGSITDPTITNSDQFPHNGTTTISTGTTIPISSGTVSAPNISGVDNGSLILIGSLELYKDTVFVINPGSKIINQGGYLIKNTFGTQIVKGYLWAKDTDNDGCFTGPIKYTDPNNPNTAPATGYRRVKDLSYTEPSTADDDIYGEPPACTNSSDFYITINPQTATVVKSASDVVTSTTISVSWTGTAQEVLFTITGIPSGVTANTLSKCTSFPCSRTLTFTISPGAIAGYHNININATSGAITHIKTFQLIIDQSTCPNCQTNNTDSCTGTCSSYCGASASCDGKTPNYTWTSSSNCYWCNSSCIYGSSYIYPSSYYPDSGTCFYNCPLSCQIGGGTCSSDSCSLHSENNICYVPLCTSQGCTYSTDFNRECDDSICTTEGWDNSACCTNDCSYSGQVECVGNAVKTCGYHDPDDCLDWNAPVDCPSGYTCSGGVCQAPFDFSMSFTTNNGKVLRSSSISAILSTALISGTAQNVSFTIGTLPSGVTANTLTTCTTFPCSRTMTLTVGSTAQLGSYSITVTGTASGGLTKQATYSFRICQCTSGVCCDGCSYRPSSYQCDTITQYRCSSTSCGGDVQSRSAPKYCSGSASTCSGTTGTYSSWTTEMDCPSDMRCDSSDYSCTSEGCDCTCTSWVNTGICDYSQSCMTQIRECPNNCDSESRCVYNSSCVGCTNDCSYSGQTSCIYANLQTCGYWDSDPCLDWKVTKTAYYGSCGAACDPSVNSTHVICGWWERPYFECVNGAMMCIYCLGSSTCP